MKLAGDAVEMEAGTSVAGGPQLGEAVRIAKSKNVQP
jgi:hypothetical protein